MCKVTSSDAVLPIFRSSRFWKLHLIANWQISKQLRRLRDRNYQLNWWMESVRWCWTIDRRGVRCRTCFAVYWVAERDSSSLLMDANNNRPGAFPSHAPMLRRGKLCAAKVCGLLAFCSRHPQATSAVGSLCGFSRERKSDHNNVAGIVLVVQLRMRSEKQSSILFHSTQPNFYWITLKNHDTLRNSAKM